MIFRAHGRFVESLGGRYITAEDVGTSTADMDFVHMETEYVAGLARQVGRSVAGHGARRVSRHPGVGQACAGAARVVDGKTVAVQGLRPRRLLPLPRSCTTAGAKLIVTDIDAERVKRVVERVRRAARSDANEIYGAEGRHLRARARLAAIINDETIPQLKVEIVAGGANNQLLEERHGDELERRGILYAPDYVANAGGVINVYSELAGWTRDARAPQGRRDLRHDARRLRDRERAGHPDVRRRRSPRRAAAGRGGRVGADLAAVAAKKLTSEVGCRRSEVGWGNSDIASVTPVQGR